MHAHTVDDLKVLIDIDFVNDCSVSQLPISCNSHPGVGEKSYDFLEILVSNENGIQSYEHAQILCILTTTYQGTETRYDIVQFLKLEENLATSPEYAGEYKFNGRSDIKQFPLP